ncbi:LysR family transcriptional regulator [Ottowia caeni]|uniref:LysR family transcriptional regulator n=1 Tax=Ottowia caeni TaxID=2870339 RepID=UPI001E348770|nr:LysR family transcriptional regulator [Ottowia caeni]
MIDLRDLYMIRALGSCGSLAGAARLLGVTPPALTVRMRRLEESMGVHLAVRGARGVTFTNEGRRFFQEALEVLERMETLPERVAMEAHSVQGEIRVVAPFGFGRQYMAGIARDLHRAYPALRIVLDLSDNPRRDASGHDVVIHIGALKDSSWVGHLLATNRRLLCASPAFVERLESPLTHPSQLESLVCLRLQENDEDLTRWRFTSLRSGQGRREAVTIRVTGPLASNDGEIITQWTLQGLGIMARSEWEAGPLMAEGSLVRLLPEWQMEDAPVLALTPVRKGVSARVRVFIDACKKALHPIPWRP